MAGSIRVRPSKLSKDQACYAPPPCLRFDRDFEGVRLLRLGPRAHQMVATGGKGDPVYPATQPRELHLEIESWLGVDCRLAADLRPGAVLRWNALLEYSELELEVAGTEQAGRHSGPCSSDSAS